ncbi:MAG: hypothetical protein NTY22_05510, partial [Proteobacteria bacterium]|nr:hypothetical protein [Pseudomonadota bacterium]
MNHLIVIPTKFEAAMVSLKPSDSISLLVSGFGKGCLRSLKTILKKEPIKNITLIGMAGNLAPEDRLGHTYIIKSVTDKNDIIDLTPPSKKKIPFSYDG